MLRFVRNWLLWVLVAGLCLQLFFVGRIALMAWVNPESTSFMRPEAWRRMTDAPSTQAPAATHRPRVQRWVGAAPISLSP